MKIVSKLLVVAAILFFAACSKDNVDGFADLDVLAGKWKLSETLADPGDGSGKWQELPNDRNDYIEFKADGQLGGNIYVDFKTYAVLDSNIITFKKADGVTYQNHMYTLGDGVLSLSPAGPIWCFEACGNRYTKIE